MKRRKGEVNERGLKKVGKKMKEHGKRKREGKEKEFRNRGKRERKGG